LSELSDYSRFLLTGKLRIQSLKATLRAPATASGGFLEGQTQNLPIRLQMRAYRRRL